MKIHPVAELFPMLPESELLAMAESIKRDGLMQPCTRKDGVLLDGRNRIAACKIAGVEPRFVEYAGGASPVEFIVAANLHRRHLSREQRDDVIRGLRAQGMTLQKIAASVGVGQGTVQRAVEGTLPNGKVEGADGKARPAHYAPREPQPEPEEPMHYEIYDAHGGQEAVTVPPGHELRVVPIQKPHVANNGGDNEWYTPKPYIDAARAVMGQIDLDPASSPEANKVVKAAAFYTAEDNGLKHRWAGKVWMNPPYAADLVGKFSEKLAAAIEAAEVKEAIVLVNNATETKWFARLASASSHLCFPTGRVKFWHPRKEAVPLQGQALLYAGCHGKRFAAEFSKFGIVAEIVR